MTLYRPNITRNGIFLDKQGVPFFLDPIGKNSPLFFKNKKVDIHHLSLYTSPYDMVVDPINADSKITVNGNSSDVAKMSNDSYGIVDIRGLTEQSTSKNYKIKITRNDQQICNDGIHAKCILGTAKNPFEVWPLIIPETNSLSITVDDLSGSSNTIRPCFKAFKYSFDVFNHLPPDYVRILKNSSFYIYTTSEDIALPSTQDSVRRQIKINSTHDFLAKRLTQYSDGEFLIKMSYGRASLSNGWVHSSSLGGDSEYYSDFMQNITFERTTRIDLELKNLSGSTNNVYLALSGIAFFDK